MSQVNGAGAPHTNGHSGGRASGSGRASSRRAKPIPHFVIFQGDEFGFKGWVRKDGSRKNRWDTLLDAMLKCVMMDGTWHQEVRASLFVGADAVHVSGAIQPLVMQVVGTKSDGRPMYTPATTHSWEEALWSNYSRNQPGLRWELDETEPLSQDRGGSPQVRLLRRLEHFLARDQMERGGQEAAAIALDYKNVDSTYETLKVRGKDREPRSRVVYVLLGGAHGFDGKNDADGLFFEEVIKRFCASLGRNRVAKVNLCEDGPPEKFTAAKVAAFLSVEHARGMLGHVVAGLEELFSPRPMPSACPSQRAALAGKALLHANGSAVLPRGSHAHAATATAAPWAPKTSTTDVGVQTDEFLWETLLHRGDCRCNGKHVQPEAKVPPVSTWRPTLGEGVSSWEDAVDTPTERPLGLYEKESPPPQSPPRPQHQHHPRGPPPAATAVEPRPPQLPGQPQQSEAPWSPGPRMPPSCTAAGGSNGHAPPLNGVVQFDRKVPVHCPAPHQPPRAQPRATLPAPRAVGLQPQAQPQPQQQSSRDTPPGSPQAGVPTAPAKPAESAWLKGAPTAQAAAAALFPAAPKAVAAAAPPPPPSSPAPTAAADLAAAAAAPAEWKVEAPPTTPAPAEAPCAWLKAPAPPSSPPTAPPAAPPEAAATRSAAGPPEPAVPPTAAPAAAPLTPAAAAGAASGSREPELRRADDKAPPLRGLLAPTVPSPAVVRGLCFRRPRDLLLAADRELRRLDGSSPLDLPSVAEPYLPLLRAACEYRGALLVEERVVEEPRAPQRSGGGAKSSSRRAPAAAAARKLRAVPMELEAEVRPPPLPLEALIPKTWARGGPSTWRSPPDKAGGWEPFVEVPSGGAAASLIPSHTATLREIRPGRWSMLDGAEWALTGAPQPSSASTSSTSAAAAAAAAAETGGVATIRVQVPRCGPGGSAGPLGLAIALCADGSSAASLDRLLEAQLAQEDRATASAAGAGPSPGAAAAGSADPYVLLLRSRGGERGLQCRGALLSNHLAGRPGGVEVKPLNCEPATPSEGAAAVLTLWVAFYPGDRQQRCVEVGQGSFPDGRGTFKVTLPPGPPLRSLALASLPPEEARSTPSAGAVERSGAAGAGAGRRPPAQAAGVPAHLRAQPLSCELTVERGLCPDLPGLDHVVLLCRPEVAPTKASPAEGADVNFPALSPVGPRDLAKRVCQGVVAWWPWVGDAGAPPRGELGPPRPGERRLAVCSSAEAAKALLAEAKDAGWSFGRLGEPALQRLCGGLLTAEPLAAERPRPSVPSTGPGDGTAP